MKKHTYEKHSLSTLARRFKGLAARNTLAAWIEGGRLPPLMTDKTAAPYLYRREDLDRVGAALSKNHDALVEKLEKNPVMFRAIRQKARNDAVAILNRNEALEASGRPDLAWPERDPGLDQADAIGATKLSGRPRGWRIVSCTLSGKKWKGEIK